MLGARAHNRGFRISTARKMAHTSQSLREASSVIRGLRGGSRTHLLNASFVSMNAASSGVRSRDSAAEPTRHSCASKRTWYPSSVAPWLPHRTFAGVLAWFGTNWCRGWGTIPHGPFGPQDFKSCASASSATPACDSILAPYAASVAPTRTCRQRSVARKPLSMLTSE
jgi:hypothetical protein